MNVADALIPKTNASGDAIVRQGDPAEGMYFVESGIVEVFVEDRGSRKKVHLHSVEIIEIYSHILLVKFREINVFPIKVSKEF